MILSARKLRRNFIQQFLYRKADSLSEKRTMTGKDFVWFTAGFWSIIGLTLASLIGAVLSSPVTAVILLMIFWIGNHIVSANAGMATENINKWTYFHAGAGLSLMCLVAVVLVTLVGVIMIQVM